jgi:hypothetical protein
LLVKRHNGKPAAQKLLSKRNQAHWVEALKAVEKTCQQAQKQLEQPPEALQSKTRIIHIFDREGDIAEVFASAHQLERTGVLVRAAHDRSLTSDTAHLWEHLSTQPIQFYQEVELPATAKRQARSAQLAVWFCPVQLRLPRRLKSSEPCEVHAVYAAEINPPEGEQAVSWLLLTTESVTNTTEAATIWRWYTYRWHVEEYHKILKSGCQAESYRLAATSMEALLGFLTVIAAEKSASHVSASHSTTCPSDNYLISSAAGCPQS